MANALTWPIDNLPDVNGVGPRALEAGLPARSGHGTAHNPATVTTKYEGGVGNKVLTTSDKGALPGGVIPADVGQGNVDIVDSYGVVQDLDLIGVVVGKGAHSTLSGNQNLAALVSNELVFASMVDADWPDPGGFAVREVKIGSPFKEPVFPDEDKNLAGRATFHQAGGSPGVLGGAHWFRVTAFDVDGYESAPSREITTVGTVVAGEKITVLWTPVVFASKYRVYHSQQQGVYNEWFDVVGAPIPATTMIYQGQAGSAGAPPPDTRAPSAKLGQQTLTFTGKNLAAKKLLGLSAGFGWAADGTDVECVLLYRRSNVKVTSPIAVGHSDKRTTLGADATPLALPGSVAAALAKTVAGVNNDFRVDVKVKHSWGNLLRLQVVGLAGLSGPTVLTGWAIEGPNPPANLAGTAFAAGGTLATGTYYIRAACLSEAGETLACAEISKAVTGPTGRIDLTCDTEPGADRYVWYIGTATGAENVVYVTNGPSFSYTGAVGCNRTPRDDPPQSFAAVTGTPGTPGHTGGWRYFRVSAFKTGYDGTGGKYWETSVELEVNVPAGGYVDLSWAAVAGATKYRVFESTQPGMLGTRNSYDVGNVTTYRIQGQTRDGTSDPPQRVGMGRLITAYVPTGGATAANIVAAINADANIKLIVTASTTEGDGSGNVAPFGPDRFTGGTDGTLSPVGSTTGYPSADADAKQQLAITGGTPVSGNITARIFGQITASIPWNATAENVRAAVEALGNFKGGAGIGDHGDIIVAGGPLPATPITVEFVGRRWGRLPIAPIDIASSTLSAGTAAFTELTAGVKRLIDIAAGFALEYDSLTGTSFIGARLKYMGSTQFDGATTTSKIPTSFATSDEINPSVVVIPTGSPINHLIRPTVEDLQFGHAVGDYCKLDDKNLWLRYADFQPIYSYGDSGNGSRTTRLFIDRGGTDLVKMSGTPGSIDCAMSYSTLWINPGIWDKNGGVHADVFQPQNVRGFTGSFLFIPTTRNGPAFIASDFPGGGKIVYGFELQDSLCMCGNNRILETSFGLRVQKSIVSGARRCTFWKVPFQYGNSKPVSVIAPPTTIGAVNVDNYYDTGEPVPDTIITPAVPPPPPPLTPPTKVPRASYTLEVSWDAYSLGIFTFDVSTFDGTDTLGVSPFDFKFTGPNDDMSTLFAGGQVTRGGGEDPVRVVAGTATIDFRDPDGLANPDNAASPLFGKLEDRLHPVRLKAKYGGAGYGLFYGWARRIVWEPHGRRGTTRLECVDLAWWLERSTPTITATGLTTTGAAIGKILDAVGWTDPNARNLSVGDTILDFTSDGKKTALTLIQELLDAERGIFYVNGAGVATYLDRGRITTAQAGAIPAGVTVPTIQNVMRAIAPGVDFESALTRVNVSRTQTGYTATAVDDTAQRKGGFSDLDLTTSYLQNDSQADGLAAWLLSQSKQARKPIYDLTIDNREDALLTQILQRELSDRVAISAAHGNLAGDFYIDQITHSITPGQMHTARWLLSQVVFQTAFQFDISTFDGTDQLTY